MDVSRPYWQHRIEESWKKRPIVWLAGVRRSGKTTLSESLADTTLINCDLPSSQRVLTDPESFYESVKTKRVIFDEIHQLEDPAILLKIGSDQFKHLKLLATGSSTLVASQKFRDTLTDRKRTVRLVPILAEELETFQVTDLKTRLKRGGLPPALLASKWDREFYGEWLDSFYARDIQELFSVEKRQPFLKVLEYLLLSNGNLIETTEIGKYAGLSRPTVVRYLEILEVTCAITLVRPFSGNSLQSLVHQPKVYAFDTGFSVYANGWAELRDQDCGLLLENLVLESLQSMGDAIPIRYWRTKQKREIDFVLPVSSKTVHTIECKWRANTFSSDHLKAFRADHPDGMNFVVCSDARTSYTQRFGDLKVEFVSIRDFKRRIQAELGG